MSTLLTRLSLFLLSAGSVAGQMTSRPETRYDQAISAKNDLGDIVISTRRTLVDVTHPNWRSGKASLVVLYDPSSGYFLWGLGTVRKGEQSAGTMGDSAFNRQTYITADRILWITFAYPDLIIKESRQKASNLDDAESKSLQAAAVRLPKLLAWNQPDEVKINIAKIVPKNFSSTPPNVQMGPFKLVNVSHKGSTWEVIVQCQWQEKITLNEKFEVTATLRIN